MKTGVLLSSLLQIVMSQEFTWQAGFVEIDGLASNMMQRSMLYTLVCGVNNADCAYTDADFFNALQNYGYNCFTESVKSKFFPSKSSYYMGSNGGPVDEVDEACQEVHKSYRCMFLDHDHGDLKQGITRDMNGTVVDEECFHGINFRYHINRHGDIVCGPSWNSGYAKNMWHGCRAAACEIEKNFAYRIKSYLQNPVEFQINNFQNYNAQVPLRPLLKSAYSKPNEKKERVISAVRDLTKVLGMPKGNDMCCGQYPTRFPYNELTQECCEHAEIQAIGRCG